MDRVIVTVTNLWKWFQELLPGVKWDRLQTRAAHFTFLAAALGAVIFLIVRKYRLSKQLRSCKEKAALNRPAKEELKKIKRKSKYGTLAGILLLIILSIVLVWTSVYTGKHNILDRFDASILLLAFAAYMTKVFLAL